MRRSTMLIVSMLLLLALPATTRANTYTVVYDASASWTTARAQAILAGGYLATITTPAEKAAVQAAITASSPPRDGGFWIGLKETASECCYVWDTNESTCYGDFYSCEPNNGAPGENRGQIMWNLTDATRRGFWNDVPDAGLPGTNDISRQGYVIEFGALSSLGPCGACIRVSACSFCNSPTGQATLLKINGISTGPGIIGRTISDVTEPTSPNGSLSPQSTYLVNVPVSGAGVGASAITATFIDSVNRVAGPAGFVANLVHPGSDNSYFWMYRTAPYTSSDANTVPGITFGFPGSVGSGPMMSWPLGGALALLLAGLGSRWMRSRRREDI